MKKSTLLAFFVVALVILFAPSDTQAQSAPAGSAGSKQDQVIQELLGEVRQLRIALQQISVNAYRGQVMVERLRLQEEQVNKLNQEVNSARNQLRQVRSEQLSVKDKLDQAEKQRDAGVLSEDVARRVKAELEDLKRQEQALIEREGQAATQLDTERANLADLNKRLDALEVEMMTGQGDDSKTRVKR